MAFSQSGYGRSGSIARRTDEDFTRMADIPAKQTAPVQGNISQPGSSAAGIPGYYSSQHGYGVTTQNYRNLTALLSSTPGASRDLVNDGVGSDFFAPWARAQGFDVANNASNEEKEAINRSLPVPVQMADSLGGFKVRLETSDVNFLEQRRKEELALNFDTWLTRKIDISDPHNSRWVQEIHPTFFDRREAFIDEKINVEARLAKIRLRGVKDDNDLKLLFAVDTGMITPAKRPLFTAAGLTEGRDYLPGMLSIPGMFYRRNPGGLGADGRPDTTRIGDHVHDIFGTNTDGSNRRVL